MRRRFHNHGEKSWDKFAFAWSFANHTSLTPPQSHKQDYMYIRRLYPEFSKVSTLYRVGERELQDIFEKDAYVHCFMKAPRNYRKLCILHHCPRDFCPGLKFQKVLKTLTARVCHLLQIIKHCCSCFKHYINMFLA